MYCSICKKEIPDGETMWSINVNREVVEGGAITVLEADCYWIFCEDCAKDRDLSNVTMPLKGKKA